MKKDTSPKPVSEKKSHRRLFTAFLLWLALILIVAGIVALVVLPKPEEVVEEAPEKATPVRVQSLKPQRLPDIIRVPGRLEPHVEALLAAEKPGRIVEVNGDVGDAVTNGQILLRVDNRLWKTMRERAELEREDAVRDQARWKELEAAGAVAGSEFEDITLRKNTAEITLDEADIMLSQSVVRSPIDGRIEDRGVELGEYANEGMGVFTVVDIDPLKMSFDVPERDIRYVEEDRDVTFSVTALGGRTCTGRVTFVSARAHPANNAFRVECTVDNPDHRLKAGMITDVELVRDYREQALAVPLATVIPDKGEHVVFTVVDDRAVRNTVIIDAILESSAVLAKGLEPGDRYVVEGHRALSDGSLVDIQD